VPQIVPAGKSKFYELGTHFYFRLVLLRGISAIIIAINYYRAKTTKRSTVSFLCDLTCVTVLVSFSCEYVSLLCEHSCVSIILCVTCFESGEPDLPALMCRVGQIRICIIIRIIRHGIYAVFSSLPPTYPNSVFPYIRIYTAYIRQYTAYFRTYAVFLPYCFGQF
jgi:hypothetical protein